MKKYFTILILSIISIFPLKIYAYELTCDEGSYQIDNAFNCKVSGDASEYDKLSGTITTDNSLSCKISNYGDSLQPTSNTTDTFFDLTGNASSTNLLDITCTVINNPLESTSAMVMIEDFAYHILNSGVDEKSEILRSDYIKIEHKDDNTPIQTKPRDVSDPSVRPKRLSSPDLNLTFSQFITEYDVEVLFDVEEINFDYELNDQTSTIRFEGDTKLQVGDNVIDVYITNSSGTKEACYTFTIKRLARGEEIYYKESDSSLESMVIPGYSIGFDKNVYEYKIHLTRDVDSININTKPSFENATVSISQTDNLKNGTIIVVEVTSADETSRTTYKIKVSKDAPKKDYSSLIIIVLLGAAFIGAIAVFIVTSQKNKNDPLLKLKKDKRKVNKGEKFDESVVPSSENIETNTIQQEEDNNEHVNTINFNETSTVVPTQTDKVVVETFNQVSPIKQSIDLTSNVAPTQVNLGQNTITSLDQNTNNNSAFQEPNQENLTTSIDNNTQIPLENTSINNVNQTSNQAFDNNNQNQNISQ